MVGKDKKTWTRDRPDIRWREEWTELGGGRGVMEDKIHPILVGWRDKTDEERTGVTEEGVLFGQRGMEKRKCEEMKQKRNESEGQN